MADELQIEVEGADAAAAAPKKRPMVLIGMIVAGLAVGGGAGGFVAGPMLAQKMGAAPAADTAAAHEEEAPAEGAEAPVHQLDNLVLNPAGSGGTRFLLVSVALRAPDALVVEEMKSHDAEMRDVVLRVFGTKPVEELSDITKREQFKSEIRTALEPLFKKKNAVREVFFPQFVIQ